MKDLEGKVAFITGAASGIGLGAARALAQAGVKVMLCDIDQTALQAAVEDLRRTNADVDSVVADVSLKPELQAAADATMARFGVVHILHNNAGVAGGGDYGEWTDAGWNWTMAVNVMSVVWGCEIFGPLIEWHGEGGHIVNTASAAGLMAVSAKAYHVSKYGVVALSEGLRVQLAPRGIGVSVLCPGFVRSGFVDSVRNLPQRYAGEARSGEPSPGQSGEKWLEAIRDRVAAGLDPDYVGELVREGIEQDWPYIFTDATAEPLIEARFAAIKAGFDRIRERTPAN